MEEPELVELEPLVPDPIEPEPVDPEPVEPVELDPLEPYDEPEPVEPDPVPASGVVWAPGVRVIVDPWVGDPGVED